MVPTGGGQVVAVTTPAAFAAERGPALLRLAVTLTGGDRGLAEDVVQETLLRVHRRWAEISGLDLPDAYVKRMVVNEYLSWRRKWARWVPTSDVGALLAAGADPSDGQADRAALIAEIASLPARQRAAVTLRFYEDWSYAEIATALGCAETGARTLVSRALARLRVRIAEDDDRSDDARRTTGEEW